MNVFVAEQSGVVGNIHVHEFASVHISTQPYTSVCIRTYQRASVHIDWRTSAHDTSGHISTLYVVVQSVSDSHDV